MNHDETHAASFNILLRSLEELVPPRLLNGLLNHAGQRLGRATSAQYRARRKKKSDGFTPKDYTRAITANRVWSVKPIEVLPNLIRVAIAPLPAIDQEHFLAPFVSGFFGSVAADLFGAARVVVVAGPKGKGLMVTVGSGPSSLSWQCGDSYTKEVHEYPRLKSPTGGDPPVTSARVRGAPNPS